ncbi:hypothetical protein ACN47E_001728 [Coniothyrium glycines]
MVTGNFGEPGGHSIATSWAKTRPLSDIREITEPSLVEPMSRQPEEDTFLRSTSRSEMTRKTSLASKLRPSMETRGGENREPRRKDSVGSTGHRIARRGRSSRSPSPPSPADNHSISSIYSIPATSVPPRSSSRTRARSASRNHGPPQLPPIQATQQPFTATYLHSVPMIPLQPPMNSKITIPSHGQSHSPLRHIASHREPNNNEIVRRVPSKTFIREPVSKELLEFPSHRHPRIELGLDLTAGIFMGGGSIEGTVQLEVDDAERIRHRRTLDIARISIDLLRLEEMNGNRRCVFLNLASELIDEHNPPPQNMVYTQEPIGSSDVFWHLMPSTTNLAFNENNTLSGYRKTSQSFQSTIVRTDIILLCDFVLQAKQYVAEKALMSLPSPLTASDEWIKPRESTIDTVRVTAGLHRQVWVSGTCIYVDVHIVNNSQKTVKRIELQLERDILCYKHVAASTMEKSAGQARIFDSNERSILSKSLVKPGSAGWHGVSKHQTHIRTCSLDVPRGHATVKCGKYFEVRYFLNVIVGSTHTKLVTVQLPIVLIHMNSLDIVPNSVAQVALAIEEKRTVHALQHNPSSSSHLRRRPSLGVQGRAFAAPRMQSLDRMRARAEDLQEIGQALDQSPRKYVLRRTASTREYHTPPSNRKGRILGEGEAADLQDRLRRVRSNESIGSRRTLHQASSAKSRHGAVSVLGFREAEVREDMELGGLGAAGDGPLNRRLEQSRERQYRFSKKRSVERWKGVAKEGVGWLKGNGASRIERERDDWV